MELQLKGKVLTSADSDYHLCKDRVYNKRFTEYSPEMVCLPSNTDDVVKVVKYAASQNKKIIVRCGGHSMYGLSACKQGEILLDMSLMNRVLYDQENDLALIDGGCLLVHVNSCLAKHNKAIPVGDMGLVGISGLILNGGFGALTNTAGTTLDLVEEIEIVTGQGEAIIANKNNNADIFAALKQGCSAGRYMGVITSFSVKAISVPTQILGGLAKKKVFDAASEISAWANYCVANPTKFVGCYLFGAEDATAEILYNYAIIDGKIPDASLTMLLNENPKIDDYAEALNKLTPLLIEKECRMCNVEMLVPSWDLTVSQQIEAVWKDIISHSFLRSKSIIFIHYAKPPQRNEMFWLQLIIGWEQQSYDAQAFAVAEKARLNIHNIMGKFGEINSGWHLDRQLIQKIKEKVDPMNIFPRVC